jgi:hypothetical protein
LSKKCYFNREGIFFDKQALFFEREDKAQVTPMKATALMPAPSVYKA